MSRTIPQTLQELHRLRKHLRDLKQEIDLGPRVRKLQEQALENQRQSHAAAHDMIGKIKLKIRDDEGTLKQLNGLLAKYEGQLNDSGSPKEYEAKQTEIRHTKEKIAATEETVLMQMEDLENRIADLPNVDKQWAAAQAEFEQAQVEAKERLEVMQTDQKQCQALLIELEASLPASMKSQYERLVKNYGPEGLAGVVSRTCQQCRTNISEQQRSDILSGKFLCCSTCGRALYIVE